MIQAAHEVGYMETEMNRLVMEVLKIRIALDYARTVRMLVFQLHKDDVATVIDLMFCDDRNDFLVPCSFQAR